MFFPTQMSEIESKVAEAASSQQGLSKTLSQMGKAVDDLGRLGCHYQTGADLRDKAAACLQREKTRLAEELFRTRVELKQAKEEIQQMRAEGKEGTGEIATKVMLFSWSFRTRCRCTIIMNHKIVRHSICVLPHCRFRNYWKPTTNFWRRSWLRPRRSWKGSRPALH